MKQRKTLAIFAIILMVSSILRLTGWHISIIDKYNEIATSIMTWFIPDLFSSTIYPTSVRVIVILIPLVFVVGSGLFIFKLIKYRYKTRRVEGLEVNGS